MNLQEFKIAVKRHEKSERIRSLIGIVLFGAFIAINYLASLMIQEADYIPEYWVTIPWMIIFFGILIASPINDKIRIKRISRERGIACRSCNQPFSPSEIKIVIASGRCPHCGAQTLNTNESEL